MDRINTHSYEFFHVKYLARAKKSGRTIDKCHAAGFRLTFWIYASNLSILNLH